MRSMPRKGNRVDDGATNQVFGHLKDGFFRSREFPDLEAFNRELEEHIECWNTQRRRVKLKGLTPKEFRSQSTAAQVLVYRVQVWDAVQLKMCDPYIMSLPISFLSPRLCMAGCA